MLWYPARIRQHRQTDTGTDTPAGNETEREIEEKRKERKKKDWCRGSRQPTREWGGRKIIRITNTLKGETQNYWLGRRNKYFWIDKWKAPISSLSSDAGSRTNEREVGEKNKLLENPFKNWKRRLGTSWINQNGTCSDQKVVRLPFRVHRIGLLECNSWSDALTLLSQAWCLRAIPWKSSSSLHHRNMTSLMCFKFKIVGKLMLQGNFFYHTF